MPPRTVIRTKGLTKDFGPVKAVDDLDFIRPTDGEVSVFGRSPRDPEIRRRIGYLPGELALDPRHTARAPSRSRSAARSVDVDARSRSRRPSRWGYVLFGLISAGVIEGVRFFVPWYWYLNRNIVAEGPGLESLLVPLGLAVAFASVGVWRFGGPWDLH